MPGSVLATEVDAGAAVAKGDLLLIMEAMKMEHRITAPRDGVVETVHVLSAIRLITASHWSPRQKNKEPIYANY